MKKSVKSAVTFECVECGYQSPKYYGRCPQCQNWNSMVESETGEAGEPGGVAEVSHAPQRLSDIDGREIGHHATGIAEFDRVLGGGIVPQSVVLIGGEPGVGKSTLLLEVSGVLARSGQKVLYYSGEESASQIKLRADRLGISSEQIFLYTIGTLEEMKKHIADIRPQHLIIDSIQTIHSSKTSHMSGSPSALRHLTAEIISLAKSSDLTVFIIGHITKEGQLAGPKTLEHMVDAVLYFQGETQTDVRILRAEKNRFGPMNEIGVFQMGEKGLVSVQDPSQLFLQHRRTAEPGTAVFPVINGLRALLTEVQALTTESPFVGNPRRIAIGFDSYRMSMLISVIEKKLKLPFYKSDVFLNMTGGMIVRDPAADLAVAAALISSYKGIPVGGHGIFLGELGLTGEVRPVSFLESRLKEAIRQGFLHFYLPRSQSELKGFPSVSVTPVESIQDLQAAFKKKPA
jgi:DNA repair protein RadA/Sms